jgi:hypothetical protein
VLNRNFPSGLFFSLLIIRMGLSAHGPPGPAWDGSGCWSGPKGPSRSGSFWSLLWSAGQCPAPLLVQKKKKKKNHPCRCDSRIARAPSTLRGIAEEIAGSPPAFSLGGPPLGPCILATRTLTCCLLHSAGVSNTRLGHSQPDADSCQELRMRARPLSPRSPFPLPALHENICSQGKHNQGGNFDHGG